MEFITEKTIDTVAEKIGRDQDYFLLTLRSLEEEQPIILAYLFSDTFEAFAQEEREFLLYLVLVIYQSFKRTYAQLPPVEEEQLGRAEEENWELMNGTSARRFRDRLDTFFENYEQEDLLAFAEDALADDEEEGANFIAKESRDALFIALKSIIDCLGTFEPV